MNNDTETLLAQLRTLEEADRGPFPYRGCFQLKATSPERYHDLTPDLDVYLSEIAGYRSWGRRILRWADDKIESVQSRLRLSFFDRFPAYTDLKALLALSVAPDVAEALDNADQTRAVLLELLRKIQAARADSA